MEKEQRLLWQCLEIFGTDDPEQWKLCKRQRSTMS